MVWRRDELGFKLGWRSERQRVLEVGGSREPRQGLEATEQLGLEAAGRKKQQREMEWGWKSERELGWGQRQQRNGSVGGGRQGAKMTERERREEGQRGRKQGLEQGQEVSRTKTQLGVPK